MTDMSPLAPAGPDVTQDEIIKLACLAVGGQGGGCRGVCESVGWTLRPRLWPLRQQFAPGPIVQLRCGPP